MATATPSVRITLGDVAEVAERLTREGKVVSTTSVRKELGRGSYTTVMKLLVAWNDQHAKALGQTATTPVSEALAAAYGAEVTAQVQGVKRAAERELSVVVAARDEALQQLEQFESEMTALVADRDAMRASRDEVQGRLVQLHDDFAQERDRLAQRTSEMESRAREAELRSATAEARFEAAVERADAADSRERELRAQLSELLRQRDGPAKR